MSTLDVSQAIQPITDATPRIDGAMLPERVLQEMLKSGFAALKADQSTISELFHKLDLATLNDIKAFYAANSVTVRLNFPRDDLKFPVVAIVTQSEDTDPGLELLGHHMDYGYEGGSVVTYKGLGQRCSYQLYCLAGKDSNAVIWLTHLVKAILLVNMDELHKHGLNNVTLNTRDVTLREDLFTEFTYGRVIGVTCDTYFGVKVTEKVANSLGITLYAVNHQSGTKIPLDGEAS
jgi:hypothetical protein